MPDIKTSRPFRERFLNGFDRSQLRQEVQAVQPKRFRGMRKKYATWALGASLALGGIGTPIKMIHDNAASKHASDESPTPAAAAAPDSETPAPADQGIASDLKAAQTIATQVAGGVQAVTSGVAQAATHPLQTVKLAPQNIANAAETVKEHFFRTEVPFGSIIYTEAKKNDLPPELVAAVVNTESKFKPTAHSQRGAVGLMQLVPRTGRWMGARNLSDPAQNIMAGAKYLKYLTDRFGGDQQKAIAAYNAGEGNVRRFGGVPPFRETRNYVNRVQDFQDNLGDRIDSHAADMSQVASLQQ
ncbi:MAG TPA: lytic transglycosylase domain-containing protein [Thermoanaerobaculia bacterium]|nr:lytic transglycosylase domain-containing protein [Thermoanaerobaculia bacterium]